MTGGTLVCGQRLDGCRRQGDPVITRAVFIDLKIATLCQKLRLERAPQSPSLPGGSERLPPFCRPGPCPGCRSSRGRCHCFARGLRARQIKITGRGQLPSRCELLPLYPPWQAAAEVEWGRAAEDSPTPATAQPIPTKMPCPWHCAPQRRDGGTQRRAAGTRHSTWSGRLLRGGLLRA